MDLIEIILEKKPHQYRQYKEMIIHNKKVLINFIMLQNSDQNLFNKNQQKMV